MEEKVKGGRGGNTPKLEYLLSTGKRQVKKGVNWAKERTRQKRSTGCGLST